MSHRIATATKSIRISGSRVPAHRQPTKLSPHDRQTKDILAMVPTESKSKPAAQPLVIAPKKKSARKDPSQAAARRIGRYQVARPLHKGRISHVMLGKMKGIGGVERSVAIKILRSRFAQDKRHVDGLLHEERVTSSLSHPNIVQLVDSGESDYGFFMAMEYIKGWNLQELIDAASATSQTIPMDVALSIAHGVASGLHYLHDLLGNRDARVRMVHRDVQPSNLMLSESGFVKIIDFGGVTIEGMERENASMFATVNGYTPPEVMSRRHVDRRGDIYSLGALLYEMSTGRAFRRDEMTGQIMPPSTLCPDVAEDLEALIMRMVHPDPERRLQSAASLQFAFEELATKYRFTLSQRRVAQFAKRVMDRRSASSESKPAQSRRKANKSADRLVKKSSKSPMNASTTGSGNLPGAHKSSKSAHASMMPAVHMSDVLRDLSTSRRALTDMSKTRVHISRQPR